MIVAAITMVKDEIDIIEQSVLNMIDQKMDKIVLMDNMSRDGTFELIKELEKKYPQIHVLTDSEIGYYQSKKMTTLSNYVHEKFDADWIVPFDADEFWYAQDQPLADYLKNLENIDVVIFPVWNMIATNDHPEADPLFNMTHRRVSPAQFPVVAFRWAPGATIAQGNHAVHGTGPNLHITDNVGVKEYQYRSFKQFVLKVKNGKAAYDATNLPYSEGQHWREYGSMSEEQLREIWNSMMNEKDLVSDPW